MRSINEQDTLRRLQVRKPAQHIGANGHRLTAKGKVPLRLPDDMHANAIVAKQFVANTGNEQTRRAA